MTKVPFLDVDDFPAGTWVQTPTGRLGIVKKIMGAQSKQDLFQRVVVVFDQTGKDSVSLQPHHLKKICPKGAAGGDRF